MNRYSRQAKPEVKKITSTRVSGRCRHTDEKAGAGGDFPESLLRRRSAAVWIESVLFAAPRSMAPITLGSCFERAITVSLARSRSRPTHRRQRCALGDPRAAGISYINFASAPYRLRAGNRSRQRTRLLGFAPFTHVVAEILVRQPGVTKNLVLKRKAPHCQSTLGSPRCPILRKPATVLAKPKALLDALADALGDRISRGGG